MLKLPVYNNWRDANNYHQEKNTPVLKDNSLSVQFSAIVNRFIVKTYLNSTFTNDLKENKKNSKNVHSCRLSLFKDSDQMVSDEASQWSRTKINLTFNNFLFI